MTSTATDAREVGDMSDIVFEGHACTDCTMVIANGDTSGIEDLKDWEARFIDTALYERGTVVMACDDDCEGEFRTDACDYCGTTLAGDRHPIAVLA